MAKVPGYKIVLQLADKTLVGYRSHSMDIEAEMGDATTGESTEQWKEVIPLFKGGEFSVSGLYDPTSGANTSFDDAFVLLAAGTQLTAKFGGTTPGDIYYQAECHIRHAHIEGPHDDLASYTLDLVITGEVEDEVVPET